MADIQKTVSIVFQGEDKASSSVDSINKSLKGLDDSSRSATTGVAGVNQEVDKLAAKDKAIAAVGDAFKAFTAGLVLKEFIEANIAAEKFEATMRIVTGSTEGATRALGYVRDVANRLGIDVSVAGDVFAKFSAATKGTAIEGERGAFIFEAFSKAILATGGNTNDVSGAFTQLTQGISKGRFELEDLKSIAERIPGFFSRFSESLGVSTEQLFKLISAGQIGTKEISAFAQTLNQSFQDVQIDTFEAALARFRNSLNEVYVELGKSGVFEGITKGVQVATGAVVGAVSIFKLLGETLGNLAFTLASKDFANFGTRFDESVNKAADSVRSIRDQILTLKDATNSSIPQVVGGMDMVPKTAEAGKNAIADLNKTLKGLGLDPKQFEDPIATVRKLFADLAADPNVTGEQLLAGLLISLDKVQKSEVPEFIRLIEQAMDGGKLSAEQYAVAMEALSQKEEGLFDTIIRTNKATKDQEKALKEAAKEAKEAEERANKLAIEWEKIASNERLKQIEFKVQLDLARVQADTEKFKATLDSLNKGLESTGNVINAAFGALGTAGGFYGLEKLKIIEDQIEKENAFRREQFDLQKELVTEQIRRLKAQTEAAQKGDGIIKIDGSGLAPQLEAFMWEVLRAIQVRVNNDGLPLLLGI